MNSMDEEISNNICRKEKFNSTDRLTIIIGSVLSSLAIIMEYYSVDILVLLLSIVFVIFAIYRQGTNSLYLVALAIPNTRVLEILGISAAVCICGVVAIAKILKKKQLDRKLFSLLLVYLLYSFQFILRSWDLKSGLVMPVKMIVVLYFFWNIYEENNKISSEYIYKTLVYYSAGILCAFTTSLALNRISSRFSILDNDPNMLAIEAVFIISSFFVLYFRTTIVTTPVFLIEIFSLSIVCLLAGSRTGLVILAFVYIFSFIMNLKRINKTLVVLIALILVAGVFLQSSMGKQAVKVLAERSIALQKNENFSNGRDRIWREYIEVLNDNKIRWFIGIGDYTKLGIEDVAHNFLLEDISSYGLIGTGILYYIYFYIFKRYLKILSINIKYRLDPFVIIPFSIPIIAGITLHGLTNIPNTLMLCSGAMIIGIFGKRREVKNESIANQYDIQNRQYR